MKVPAVLCLVFLGVLLSQPVAAAPAPIEKQYKAALKLENAGDLVGALAAFEAIAPELRDYNTKLHIAGCKEKLGRLRDAERDYEAIRTDPKADPATVETAAAALQDLRSRIPTIRLRLTAPAADLVVTVDGAEAKAPGEHRLDPGTHFIVAKRGAAVVFERRVNIADSASIEVEIDVPIASSATPAAPSSSSVATVSSPAADKRAGPPLRTLGLISAGVGVVALAGGGFFALNASKRESESRTLAAQGDASSADRMDDARSAQTWARIGLTVGVVGVVGGVVLILSAPSASSSPALGARGGVHVGASVGSTWGLSVTGAF